MPRTSDRPCSRAGDRVASVATGTLSPAGRRWRCRSPASATCVAVLWSWQAAGAARSHAIPHRSDRSGNGCWGAYTSCGWPGSTWEAPSECRNPLEPQELRSLNPTSETDTKTTRDGARSSPLKRVGEKVARETVNLASSSCRRERIYRVRKHRLRLASLARGPQNSHQRRGRSISVMRP